MKKSIFFFLIGMVTIAKAQRHTLEKIWETDPVIAVPESVLPDIGDNILYVSLINGGAWNTDGVGGVGKLSPNGKQYDSTWITGLNAPKGLGKYGNRIYVADIAEVVIIDVKMGKIEKKIPIENASGLNDITVDPKGMVYVSDSRTAKIWKIGKNDTPVLYLDNVKSVNGLKAIGDELYIGAGTQFMKASKDKSLVKIAELPQGIDGIEPVGNGDFILTAWSGYIFYVTARGEVETLLDSHAEKMNTADIGFDQQKRMLYVPTFNAKKIVAFKLK